MVLASNSERPAGRLRTAIVLGTTEDACTVVADGDRTTVSYAVQFPSPRVERVSPGHLVAIASVDGRAVVVWRWFDAVVVKVDRDVVNLWEPGHGFVLAQPRDPLRTYRPGSRAYLSAGLPGAEWWVAGPAVDTAEHADVELDEVEQFVVGLGLWATLG